MGKIPISKSLLLLIITYLCVFNLAFAQDNPQLVKNVLATSQCVDTFDNNCTKNSDCGVGCIDRHKDKLMLANCVYDQVAHKNLCTCEWRCR